MLEQRSQLGQRDEEGGKTFQIDVLRGDLREMRDAIAKLSVEERELYEEGEWRRKFGELTGRLEEEKKLVR